MLKPAMWYAQHGYAVFPLHTVEAAGTCSCGRADCDNVGKHPRTAHGLSDATTDLDKVREFWTRWPDANVGIATGASGLVVIDVDPKNGGDESFETLRSELGATTFETVTALTGGGGEHYYFRDEFSRYRNSTSLIAPGIDVRAVGGYVVAPPSIHASGRKYAWEASSRISDVVIADLPESLAQRLRKPAIPITSDGANVIELRIKEGGRDNKLAAAAGALRRKGFDEDEIYATIAVTNRKRCDPPLPEADVRRIAKSIARYTPEAPIGQLAPEPTATLVAVPATLLVPQQAGFAVMRSWLQPTDDRRYEVGLRDLDSVLNGLRPGEMTVLGAWTGVGKSGLSEQAALHISRSAKTLFLPLELGIERTERRMLAKILQTSEDNVEYLERSDLHEHKLRIHDAMEQLQNRKLSMLAPRFGEVYFYSHIEQIVREQKPDVVFIDHLQHIEDWTPSAAKRSDLNAAKIVRQLRALSDELKVHVFCVHQLKAQPGGMRKSQRPALYDFSDTAALSRVADTVLMLHRPFRGAKHKDKIMEILVLKNRRGPEPWIHTHFEGSHIALYTMDPMEAALAECCSVKTPVAHR